MFSNRYQIRMKARREEERTSRVELRNRKSIKTVRRRLRVAVYFSHLTAIPGPRSQHSENGRKREESRMVRVKMRRERREESKEAGARGEQENVKEGKTTRKERDVDNPCPASRQR